jgi:hypothetical protein
MDKIDTANTARVLLGEIPLIYCGLRVARNLEAMGLLQVIGSKNGSLIGKQAPGFPPGFLRAEGNAALEIGAEYGAIIVPVTPAFPGDAQYSRWARVLRPDLLGLA